MGQTPEAALLRAHTLESGQLGGGGGCGQDLNTVGGSQMLTLKEQAGHFPPAWALHL